MSAYWVKDEHAEDYQEWLNGLMENAPESFDADEAMENLATRYVRALERIVVATVSLNEPLIRAAGVMAAMMDPGVSPEDLVRAGEGTLAGCDAVRRALDEAGWTADEVFRMAERLAL